MDLRRLGDSGLKVSEIGLGCNNFGWYIDQDQTRAVVDAAIAEGINFFDTADMYGGMKSEVFLGEALKGRRHEVILATKFGLPTGASPYQRGGSRRYIIQAVEASLRRLQTDYIDLYQLHRPDPDTPIEETLSALDDLIGSGKVRYIGCSNFAGWQIADADWTARRDGRRRFITAQNNYSLLQRDVEEEVAPACARFGLGRLPFFPLASGMLTGKYRRSEAPSEGTRMAEGGERWASFLTQTNFDRVERLGAWAADHGHTLLELAFAWLLGHPVVPSVIAGATKPEQIKANAAASAWKLTPSEMAEVTGLVG